ncbi:MAG: hypothetical protein GXO79_16005 [Chlorobi bacterium]|nr:hypothetical protein [Chlorobiota bacterium]
MANDYIEIITNLKHNIDELIDKFNNQKKYINKLEENNKDLTAKLNSKDLDYKNLENRFNTLQLAKSMISTSDDSHDARIKINRIVREIDNCIALLNR